MDKKKEYQRICKKLVFITLEFKMPDFETEDDSWVNPFSVLTVEEINFLFENGYLNPKSDVKV